MIFKPKSFVCNNESLVLSGEIAATAHPCINKDLLKEFWYNFTFQSSTLKLSECEELVFTIGNAKKLPLDGHEYSINVTADGACVFAESEQALIRGYMMLLDCMKAIDKDDGIAVELACGEILDKPTIKTRMVHFCIFPDTELWQLQRFVRFCGALKYTHIILEFWSMLKFDCMKELAWPHGFTKEEVRPIIREAQELGMEVVPMFNHWGHASGCRIMHGKHVVLDQNPRLQTFFSDDGWCWDIKKEKVKALLRSIRAEMIELCGDGDYFHIGCDEAFTYEQTPENTEMICNFINEISAELKEQNRRAIAWGDMFLYRYPHYNPNNKYACFGASPEAAQKMLELVSRDVLIADWQYYAKEAPIETSAEFLNAGFDCMLCPSVKGEAQLNAVLNTIKEQPALGFMQTNWHELAQSFYYVLLGAVRSYGEVQSIKNIHGRTEAAALMRKAMPIHGDYHKAGWSRYEINNFW